METPDPMFDRFKDSLNEKFEEVSPSAEVSEAVAVLGQEPTLSGGVIVMASYVESNQDEHGAIITSPAIIFRFRNPHEPGTYYTPDVMLVLPEKEMREVHELVNKATKTAIREWKSRNAQKS